MTTFPAYLFDPAENAIEAVELPNGDDFELAARLLIGAPFLRRSWLTPDTQAVFDADGHARPNATLWIERKTRALPRGGPALLVSHAGMNRLATPHESPQRLATMVHVLGQIRPPAPALTLAFSAGAK